MKYSLTQKPYVNKERHLLISSYCLRQHSLRKRELRLEGVFTMRLHRCIQILTDGESELDP